MSLPRAIAAVLVLLAALWVGRGALVFTDNGADLAHRWQDVHTMLRGIDPNTLTERVLHSPIAYHSPDWPGDALAFHGDLAFPGRPWAIGVYPPWSYVIAAPLHAPGDLSRARALYAFAWAGTFAAVALWLYRRHAAGGRVVALAASAAVLAHAGFSTDLAVGNYGLLCFALMIAVFAALERGRPVLAGLLLGIGSFKAFVTLPFALVLLARREHWAGLPVALAVPLAASAVHWYLTGVDPLTSLVASQSHNDQFASSTGGLPALVERVDGAYRHGSQYASALVVLALGAFVMLSIARERPLGVRFALAALISCAWTYHRNYDFVVIGFVTLACIQVLLARLDAGAANGPIAVAALVVLALGASTWVPTSVLGGADATTWRIGVWTLATLWLLRGARPTAGAARARDTAARA